MADASNFAGYNQIFDPTSTQVDNGFNVSYPGKSSAPARSFNPYHDKQYSTRDNTALNGQLTALVAEAVRELVLVDSTTEPFTNRISPFLFVPQLNITKTNRKIVRTGVPFVPHKGALHKTRIKQHTQHRRQQRKGLEVSIEITSLLTPEGVRDLSDLIITASQNVLDSHVADIMLEIATYAETQQSDNRTRKTLPGLSSHQRSNGLAQQNAITAIFNLRIQQFAALVKQTLAFDVFVDSIKNTIKRRGGNPDTIIMGPGIKTRVSLSDPTRVFYYAAGERGALLRINGTGTIDTHQGLAIVEVIQPDSSTFAQTRAEREVEVGEWYPMLHNKLSNPTTFDPSHRSIQIYNEPDDDWYTVRLSDMVARSRMFSRDGGELAPQHQHLADDYNRNNGMTTKYSQHNSLDENKKIPPHQISMFLTADNEGDAQVASMWGQLDSTTYGGIRDLCDMSLTFLTGLSVPAKTIADIAEGLEVGARLLADISREKISNDAVGQAHVLRVVLANLAINAGPGSLVNRNELNQVTDARGNQFGSYNYGVHFDPTNATTFEGYADGRGAGFGNGAGIRELASHAGRNRGVGTGADSIFGRARTFVNAVDMLVGALQRVLPESHAINPATGSAHWFHSATPTSTFIDTVFAAFEMPIWTQAVNDNVAQIQETEVRVPDFRDARMGGNADWRTAWTDALRIAQTAGASEADRLAARTAEDTLMGLVEARLNATFVAAGTRAAANATTIMGSTVAVVDILRTMIREGEQQDRAVELMQAVLEASDLNVATDLALIDIRVGAVMAQIRPNLRPFVYRALAVLLSTDDISPAALRSLSAKKYDTVLKRIRAVVTYVDTHQTERALQDRLRGFGEGAGRDVKAWYKEIKSEAERNSASVLDTANLALATVAPFARASGATWIRTPLTASYNMMQYIVTQDDIGVSQPSRPWRRIGDGLADIINGATVNEQRSAAVDALARTVFAAQGTAAIGSQLHTTPFFHRLLKQGGASSKYSYKRKRNAGQDDADDAYYSLHGVSGGSSRHRTAPTMRSTPSMGSSDVAAYMNVGREMDYGAGVGVMGMDMSAQQAPIGMRFPRVGRAARDAANRRAGGGGGDDDDNGELSRGRFFEQHHVPSFVENWGKIKHCSALQRGILKALFFTPITRESAESMAANADAPFGFLLFRPHIRHRMTSVWIMEAGPKVMYTAYSETDSRWSMDGEAKMLTFVPTWQSVPFLHAPQYCIALHDVAPSTTNAYISGNGVKFFDESTFYDLNRGRTAADIYAFMVPARFKPTSQLDITGVFHVDGFENNNSHALVPQYPGAPFYSDLYELHKYPQHTRASGFEDATANTLCFRGRFNTPNGGMMHNFAQVHRNTGHWGLTQPGQRVYRAGAALVPEQRVR